MDLDAALKDYFGFDSFRPGQREACEAAAAGHDVLVVMPTGSGKSLCYQIPALLGANLSIVVSPLVALMRDQVDQLARRGLGDHVGLISGQEDPAANRVALSGAARGEIKLLYVAPERFSTPGFVERLATAEVGMFVVDEAHCVSQWGHDFRPDYFRLAGYAADLGARSLFASTATATPRVAADIVRRLGLREPLQVATGFDRPNLAFAVARPTAGQKRALLTEALRDPDALPAIVYAGTRAGAEELAQVLEGELGEPARAYHAGLERERRTAIQRSFLADEIRIVVATNAFGMGIDKPNVRTVVHASAPPSLEAYYQEAGRAGRDGAPARALLLAENRDKALHVHFIKQDELDDRLPGRLAAALAQSAAEAGTLPGLGPVRYNVDAVELARYLGCSQDQLRALVGHLTRAGVLRPTPAPADRVAGEIERDFDARADALVRASVSEASKSRWRQYRELWRYVEDAECRRRQILSHFGDSSTDSAKPNPCCDACDPSLTPTPPRRDPAVAMDVDEAILSVAREANPSVGRTTCAEILHGARTKKIERNGYDELAGYASSAHMRREDILARIDELIDQRRMRTTGGRYPVLVAPRIPTPA